MTTEMDADVMMDTVWGSGVVQSSQQNHTILPRSVVLKSMTEVPFGLVPIAPGFNSLHYQLCRLQALCNWNIKSSSGLANARAVKYVFRCPVPLFSTVHFSPSRMFSLRGSDFLTSSPSFEHLLAQLGSPAGIIELIHRTSHDVLYG